MEVDMHYVGPLATAGIIIFHLWICKDFLIERISFLWWIHLLCFVGIYFTIVWLVYCSEMLLESRLVRLDLNGDGVYNGVEVTEEYKEVLKKVVNDTARKMSIYTGLIYSELITISLHIIDLVKNKSRNTKKEN